MKVRIDSWAWIPKAEVDSLGLNNLRKTLTLQPTKPRDFPGPDPKPLELFTETDDHIGIPRQFFLQTAQLEHEIDLQVTEGDKSSWPGDLQFNPKFNLTPNQKEALDHIVDMFKYEGALGCILQAGCGWGKTVGSLAIIAEMNVPTLITVHKSFLMKQWVRRIQTFLPDAEIGIVRQKKCDYEGKQIVIAMNDSLESRDYGSDFYNYFGMIVTDECHRAGAPTWSKIPPLFPARWRLGLTATPRRSDRCENAFFWHIGNVAFKGHRADMKKPAIRRVFTETKLPQSRRMNPAFISRPLLVTQLVRNNARNNIILEQTIEAAKAGRKVLVLSERLDTHLRILQDKFVKICEARGLNYTSDFYIGGRKEAELDIAAEADVIFATAQYAKEGLDIPSLDTLILATPIGDVEQAVGRITRNLPDKKTPVIVDIRDDNITKCRQLGERRWKYYTKAGWVR